MIHRKSGRMTLAAGLALVLWVGPWQGLGAQQEEPPASGAEESEDPSAQDEGAQEDGEEPPAEDEEQVGEFVEEIVVVGTRGQPRSVTESMVPVDVLSSVELVNQGDTDMSNVLRTLAPSYNVNTQPISDAATVVRPANLRNLAPDHTLALVNGKRRHRAAVITWLGNGVADASQGPDISMVPTIALDQAEVLRDGASAQYGSDAIAGVMNFRLKQARHGGSIEVRAGGYSEGDGDATSVAGNVGLPWGEEGFLNLSGEYATSDPTIRSVQRDDAAALIAAGNTEVRDPAQIWGSPEIDDDTKLWANFGRPIGGDHEFYGHANYATKTVTGGFFFRNPNTRDAVFSVDGGETLLIGDLLDAQDGVLDGSANCPEVTITDNVPDPDALAQVFSDPNCFSFQEIFPGGFTPQFGGDVEDMALTLGLQGQVGTLLSWDASVSSGSNEVDFFIRNTVNASLGPDTPTEFDPGLYKQQDLNLNFDVSLPLGDRTHLAGGLEWRDEEFEIGIGQPESFEIGALADQGFSSASNGFPGFSDIAAGTWSRSNWAVYGDLERVAEDLRWTYGLAVRVEDFEDFGTTTNGKLSGRYRFTPLFQLRGSVSTGFRAPTPGQSNAFNVTTEFDLVKMELVNRGTIPSTSRVAELRGGQPLDAEESVNYSLGGVFETGPLTLTADLFRIDLSDRLSLSQDFSLTQEEIDQLIAEGVTSAANLADFRFFTNDFDTETQGIDIVATLTPQRLGGNTNFSFLLNHTETDVVEFNPETLDANRIRELQEALPETRASLTANHRIGPWRFLGRLSYYDQWFDSEDVQIYGDEYLVDLEAAYAFNEQVTLVLGGQNVLDEVPDENRGARTGVGNRYSQYSPFGFNGAYYYARVRYDFGRTWGD